MVFAALQQRRDALTRARDAPSSPTPRYADADARLAQNAANSASVA
jgi:hypothetical protein